MNGSVRPSLRRPFPEKDKAKFATKPRSRGNCRVCSRERPEAHRLTKTPAFAEKRSVFRGCRTAAAPPEIHPDVTHWPLRAPRQNVCTKAKGSGKGMRLGTRNSPHVDAMAPEDVHGCVKLGNDEDKRVATLLLGRLAAAPELEHLLQLLGQAQQARDRAVHIGGRCGARGWARRAG